MYLYFLLFYLLISRFSGCKYKLNVICLLHVAILYIMWFAIYKFPVMQMRRSSSMPFLCDAIITESFNY